MQNDEVVGEDVRHSLTMLLVHGDAMSNERTYEFKPGCRLDDRLGPMIGQEWDAECNAGARNIHKRYNPSPLTLLHRGIGTLNRIPSRTSCGLGGLSC